MLENEMKEGNNSNIPMTTREFRLLYQNVIPQLESQNRDDKIRNALSNLRSFYKNQRASE